MDGNINEAVDQIAQYLGCTVDTIMQYLPQYIEKQMFSLYTAQTVAIILICLGTAAIISCIICRIVAARQRKHRNIYWNEWDIHEWILCVVGIVLILVGIIIFAVTAYQIYCWETFPEVTAFENIMQTINGHTHN